MTESLVSDQNGRKQQKAMQAGLLSTQNWGANPENNGRGRKVNGDPICLYTAVEDESCKSSKERRKKLGSYGVMKTTRAHTR